MLERFQNGKPFRRRSCACAPKPARRRLPGGNRLPGKPAAGELEIPEGHPLVNQTILDC
jgi:hypothetical protein